MPALRSARAEPTTALKSGGRSLTAGAGGFSFQRMLVVFQVAVSLVLIVGALLFVRSFRNLGAVDVGMSIDHLYFAVAGFNRPGLTPEASQQMRDDAHRAGPGAPGRPGCCDHDRHSADRHELDARHQSARPRTARRAGAVEVRVGEPGYFDTIGMPLIRGRGFDQRDTASSPGVMVVNETFVRQYLDPATALGTVVRTIAEPDYPARDREVVGIVRDAKYGGLRDEVPASAFVPFSQHPAPQPWAFLAIRSSAPLATLTPG